MKLELKHLSPYLPYGLKAIYNEENEENTVVTILGTCILDKERHYQIKFKDGIVGLFIANDIKPILRPLSDFYEDIDGVSFSNMITHGYHNEFWWDENFNVNQLMYHDLQLLLSKHCDVFGLIEKGLTIDINTI